MARVALLDPDQATGWMKEVSQAHAGLLRGAGAGAEDGRRSREDSRVRHEANAATPRWGAPREEPH